MTLLITTHHTQALPVIEVDGKKKGFIAGFEWERAASPAITSAHQDLHMYHNPPSRPVLLQLNAGLEVEQCALSFVPEMSPEPEHATVGDMGARVDPWTCVCIPENPKFELSDAEFEAAVATARQTYDRISAKMEANPSLLEEAIKKIGKETGTGTRKLAILLCYFVPVLTRLPCSR
jgi:hypothetical protein